MNKQESKNNNYGKFNKVASDQSGLKYPTNLLEFDYGHPSTRSYHQQKPVKLMEYLVETYTRENETILDFTMGSGSTGIACVNLKRKFYGIEKDNEAFNLAKERINKYYSPVNYQKQ